MAGRRTNNTNKCRNYEFISFDVTKHSLVVQAMIPPVYAKRACFHCNFYVYDHMYDDNQNHLRKPQPQVKICSTEPSMNIVGKLVSATFH